MTVVKDKDKLLCTVHRTEDWEKGLDFLTEDSHFVQVGTWWYNRGKVLDRHFHNEFDRTASLTMEVIIVMSGSLEVDIYNENQVLITTLVGKKGDLFVFGHGGHGYRILSDDTKIIEVKNGPFYGVERDKTRF